MHPPIPSTTTLQIVLRVAVPALLIIGGVAFASGIGIYKRRGRLTVDKPSPVQAVVGAVMLILGAVTWLFQDWYFQPEPEVITATRFSSSAAPTLAIEMPPGWRLKHDRRAGKLVATGNGATLLVETSRVSDFAGVDSLVKRIVDVAVAAGGKGDRFEELLAGLPAYGATISHAELSSVVWAVSRGENIVTVVACKASTPSRATEGCKGALATLRWR